MIDFVASEGEWVTLMLSRNGESSSLAVVRFAISLGYTELTDLLPPSYQTSAYPFCSSPLCQALDTGTISRISI